MQKIDLSKTKAPTTDFGSAGKAAKVISFLAATAVVAGTVAAGAAAAHQHLKNGKVKG